jgi:hypothetical protein
LIRRGYCLPTRYEGPGAPAPIKFEIGEPELHILTSRGLTALHAWELFDLLKLWVSELEPEICIDRVGDLRGLGYAGCLVVPIERLRDC